jgi:hypothetical protein
MIIWSESLERIIPLCQEFEDKLIKLLWRSRAVFNNTSSASSIRYQGGVGGESSGNASLLGCPGSGSVEAFSGNGNGDNDGNGVLGRANGSSLALNLLHSSNNTPSVLKGRYGEQGRVYDELEMGEKAKDKVVSRFSDHLNGHSHDQKSEDDQMNNKTGEYKRTWYGKKVLVPPSSKQGDDLERYEGEKRPIRLYAPMYNGLAAGIALGMLSISF